MNTLRNNNKHLQLSTLAYSAGRVCLALALAFTLSVTSGVVQAAPLAATAPGLGSASNFAVLSAAPGALGAVSLTRSTVNGDVGSSGPMASVVLTEGSTITGAVIAPVSDEVLADFNGAYDDYADIECTGYLNTAYTGATLTLTPGVYCTEAAVTFTTTTLTLDGQGDANAVWIFKIGTLGTGALTGTDFSVVMDDEGDPCNVSWWVAEAATMTTSAFQGTILAGAAITVTGVAGGTPFNGDALAKAGVTLTDVTLTGCKGDDGGHHGCKDGKGKGKGHGQDCCDDGKGKGHGQNCCDDGGRGKGHGQNCCDDGGRGKGHGQNCCDDGKGKGHGQNCCDDGKGKGKGHGQNDCKGGKGK